MHTIIILSLIIIINCCRMVSSIKCYQCSSIKDRDCFNYNLNTSYLKECNVHVAYIHPAVCRSLSQFNYFTPTQDVVVLRECAHIYSEPLQCTQSKFSNIHYSMNCECNEDGCNIANDGRRSRKTVLIVVTMLYFTIKWFLCST